jgi:hypothetical protein
MTLFASHAGLLRRFVAGRGEIAARVEAVVHSLRSPGAQPPGREAIFDQIEDAFFSQADPAHRGELEQAYCAQGFAPRPVQHLFNGLIDPAEMLLRAAHGWRQTAWPGRGARVWAAHILFNLYVLRALQLLSLRIWDEGDAPSHLAGLQALLDELWRSSPPGQPRFVRDARWLIPLAQSLITDALEPYFDVHGKVTDRLPEADALEIQRAHVRMLGGHLTSQIRFYCVQDGLTLDDPSVVNRTRTSNALDLALLVQGLVALLRSYERALEAGDEAARRRMAGAILQGLSPDPELFLNHIELLRAYSMIELVFLRQRDGETDYSAHGLRHLELLAGYRALLDRLRASLREDCPRFQPVPGGCSPFGVLFGLPSTLLEHMALKALLDRDSGTRFCLEDVFDDEGPGEEKLVWVNGWRKLPHIPRETQRQFAYPQEFAEQVWRRLANALAGEPRAPGRVRLVESGPPARYFLSSDPGFGAAPCDEGQLLAWRREAHFLVSFPTAGGWAALKKDLLTSELAAGRDTVVSGVPPAATQVLRLMLGDALLAEPTSSRV